MTVWVRQQLFFMERRRLYIAIVLLLLAATFAFSLFVSPANAQSPDRKTISFSARLKGADGKTAPDGYYNVSFRLYTTSESGSPIWTETFYDENGAADGQDYRIKVTNGYLNAKLGSRTAFTNINWNNNLWLTMNIGGTTQTGQPNTIAWDGEMSPRIQLGAVPYAMNAGALDGKAAGDFIQLGQGRQTTSSDNPSININTTGKGDLVRLERNGEKIFTVDNSGNILFGSGSNHTIAIDQSADNTDGKTLAISGGDAGEGSANGGNVVLSGGSGSGSGADGLVILTNATFATTTDDSNCYTGGAPAASSCVINQKTVDSSSAVMIGFSTPNQTATLPDPTIATPGRILYVLAANDSLPLALITNGNESIAMQPKSALTLLWNGSDWVIAGHVGSPGATQPDPTVVESSAPEETMIIADGDTSEAIAIETPEQTGGQSTSQPEPQTDSDGILPFRLGRFSAAPIAEPGTMYYDTTLGKVQCYEESGWGSCSDAPDTFVTISPEYKNAVMNGTDIGIISSDFCSGTLGINDGSNLQPTVCAEDETYNFYRWTSDEESSQTRSIYLTYQLPDNFKGFIAGSTSIMGRTDSDNASVNYQIYRDNSSGLESCGAPVDVSTGLQSNWQKGLALDDSEPADCEFEAGDSILFRINLTAKRTTNAYVSNVNFIFRNN